MGRLIDADKLYRRIKAECNPYGKPSIGYEDGINVMNIIKNQPTAYDVNNVVEELEELKAEKEMGTSKVVIKECVEIVKRGGKE